MKNWEEMSDFEINCAVAHFHIGGISVYHERSHGRHDGDVWLNHAETGMLMWTNYNPCNNPSDAWPIIVENMIEISPPANPEKNMDWFVTDSFADGVVARDQNPLRAAMICFLRTKDAENENN